MRPLIGIMLLLFALPAAAGNGVRLSVIHTGNAAGTVEAMLVEGGDWLRWRKLAMTAVLIRHPRGDVLLDTGLGSQADTHFAGNSWLDRLLLRYENVAPAAEQLRAAGIDPAALHAIIPTHLHWDHVDALEDFPGVPVWVPSGAVEAARVGERPAFVPAQFDDARIRWRRFGYISGPAYGFDASADVFGDGAIRLVNLSGHTAADVGVIVTLDSGRRYFFIGDLSWTWRGVDENRPRPWIVHRLLGVDADPAAVVAMLARVHGLHRKLGSLYVVPAHDEIVAGHMARFPDFE